MRALHSALVLAVVSALFSGCSEQATPQRKQQKIALLPATPPPPPPPPKPEDKPPPPKPEDKPQPQEAPKPVDAPQPAALKSDEAAGNGPGNGLTAGAVSQDYSGQKIGQGTAIGGAPADNGANRLAATAFGNAASRALNEFLVRDKGIRLRDYQVRVALWLTPSGALQRAELVDSTGDADTDAALRSALARFPGTNTAPPAQLPQPMRVLVSNRMMG